MTRSGTVGRKHPAVLSCAAPCTQKLKDATAHGNKSSPFWSLAVRHEDHATFPIEILDPCAVEFPLVSHPRISHQGHDVAEELEGLPPPRACLSRFEQPSFGVAVKPKMSTIFLHHFDFWSVADHFPLLRFVKHSSQCPQSAVGIRGRARKFQLLGTITGDLVESHIRHRCRLQQPPAVSVELLGFLFQPGDVHPSQKALRKLAKRGRLKWKWICILHH